MNTQKGAHLSSRNFTMVKKSGSDSSEMPQSCGLTCLGPLTFHHQAVGSKVRLSKGGRLAERATDTFRNGLVFSSRPVRVQERIKVRVEKDVFNWHGGLRVGFTTVPPSARSLPLPSMAIPDLTNCPGYWAATVHESHCQAGSELQFWVSNGGAINFKSNNSKPQKLLQGVNLGQPLWALIDIYGQTCSIYLLGSEKKELLYTRRSCPAPEYLTSSDADNLSGFIPGVSTTSGNKDEHISSFNTEIPADDCVVCYEQQAKITLPCGHRCLCSLCAVKVMQQFGTCPLCRHKIRPL